MDIGVYWSRAVLAHKLERREHTGRVEEVWNTRSCPQGMGHDPDGDHLVVACEKRWRGWFRLVPEVLFTPEDPKCPYALIFDVKSWIPITETIACKPFRGWTYRVPSAVRQDRARDNACVDNSLSGDEPHRPGTTTHRH
jgi:hypothetical protein